MKAIYMIESRRARFAIDCIRMGSLCAIGVIANSSRDNSLNVQVNIDNKQTSDLSDTNYTQYKLYNFTNNKTERYFLVQSHCCSSCCCCCCPFDITNCATKKSKKPFFHTSRHTEIAINCVRACLIVVFNCRRLFHCC